jgi:glucosamine-6-phosphate deaminase
MKIFEVQNYDDLSRQACDIVLRQLRVKPNSVCVFPTGETPLGLFERLAANSNAEGVSTNHLRVILLDEYYGIAADDHRCLFRWLRRVFLDPLGIGSERVTAIDPAASDPNAEALRIESVIEELGGIDLAILGLGSNGHIGFNEPGSAFDSRARLVRLSEQSIQDNAAYWGSEVTVPPEAITLGIGTILDARSVVLLVSGRRKAGIFARTATGPVAKDVPATALHLHNNAVAIADGEALSGIAR